MQPKPYEVEEITLHEAITEYPALALTLQTYIPDLTLEQLRKVFMIVLDTCPHCHAANRKCQCWNDE